MKLILLLIAILSISSCDNGRTPPYVGMCFHTTDAMKQINQIVKINESEKYAIIKLITDGKKRIDNSNIQIRIPLFRGYFITDCPK